MVFNLKSVAQVDEALKDIAEDEEREKLVSW